MTKQFDVKRKLISGGSDFEKEMGYSRAMVAGDWCFVSGTTGYDYGSMEMPEGIAQQTSNAFQTIMKALEAGGFELGHVVRIQYTITDAKDAAIITPILGKYLGEIRPAATMVVAGLIKPEMKIEIEVTAYKG